MSILSAFKRPADTQAASPAREAYRARMQAYRAKDQQRRKIHLQDTTTANQREKADAAIAKVVSLRAAVDQALAGYVFTDATLSPPELPDLRRDLAAAEAEVESMAPVARAAAIAHSRFMSEAATLTNEMRLIYEAIPRLLHAALLEELEQEAIRFREAEEAFRAKHRAAFVIAVAADALAKAHKMGAFVRSGGHADLFITRPELPAFQRGPTDPWAAKLARDATARRFDVEAEALLNKMLNAEPEA